MMTPGEKFKGAQEFWENPPITAMEKIASKRMLPNRKTEHSDYMDFAELYADYVVDYEKANSVKRGR